MTTEQGIGLLYLILASKAAQQRSQKKNWWGNLKELIGGKR